MKIIDIHRGRAIDRLIAKCLVLENTYGVNPRKFIKISDKMIVEKADNEPPMLMVLVRETNSAEIFMKVRFMNSFFMYKGLFFIVNLIIVKGINHIIQYILNVLLWSSKAEKMSSAIFVRCLPY